MQDSKTDQEGWEYAFNWHGPWTNMPSNFGSWVRRRRWTKTRVKKSREEVENSSTIRINLKEFGIILVDDHQVNVAYFGAQGVSFNYFQSKYSRILDLAVNYFQLDDHRDNSQFPVVVSPHTQNSNSNVLTIKMAVRNDRKSFILTKKNTHSSSS